MRGGFARTKKDQLFDAVEQKQKMSLSLNRVCGFSHTFFQSCFSPEELLFFFYFRTKNDKILISSSSEEE